MSVKKRILFVHHGHARGGAFLSLLYLLRALDKTVYEPCVCSGGDEQDPEVEARCAAEGFATCSCRLPRFAHTTLGQYALGTPHGWKSMLAWFREYREGCRRLAALIAKANPDLLHLNSLTLAPYAKVARGMGVPVVVHVREPILEGTLGLRKRWVRAHVLAHASKAIAICHDNLGRLDLPAQKACVVYNPVDFGQFDHRIDPLAARFALHLPKGAPVALFAGGSVWEAKGLPEFLEAMLLVKRQFPDLICLMPGFTPPFDPSQRVWTSKRRVAWMLGLFRKNDRLYRLYKSEQLDAAIVCRDFVYDVENWIAASDVVCVPHMEPHFSRTVMEAGAMKKPVAAFAVGGVTEVVEDGVTGLLAARGDVTGLANSVSRLLADAELAARLGEGGYRQAVEKFDAGRSARQVEAVYRELIVDER